MYLEQILNELNGSACEFDAVMDVPPQCIRPGGAKGCKFEQLPILTCLQLSRRHHERPSDLNLPYSGLPNYSGVFCNLWNVDTTHTIQYLWLLATVPRYCASRVGRFIGLAPCSPQ